MEYILLDNFNGNINVICKDDGSGEPLIYKSLDEAKESLDFYCQNGQIVPLDIDIIQMLRNCEEFISIASNEGFVDDELTTELDDVL